MSTILTVVGLWFLTSVVVALVVGFSLRRINRASEPRPRPRPPKVNKGDGSDGPDRGSLARSK